MPSFRARDGRRLGRRLLDRLATAWAIASLVAIGVVAAACALVLLPVAFFGAWCLDALNAVKPIKID